MRISLPYGLERLEWDIQDHRIVKDRRQKPAVPISDPAAAVAQALESPLGFPALRRALTPDDHIAIVLDEGLPRPASLLVPILEHVRQAGVSPQAITVVRQPTEGNGVWRDELAEAYRPIGVETHDPGDRKRLSYLATTSRGRRVYLNRTVVDADQLIVLSRRGYDPVLGYSGCEGSIYPALADEATYREAVAGFSLNAPDDKVWPIRREAGEIAWLLGAPFMVQVIEGEADEIIHVLGGPADTGDEGIRLLNEQWRVRLDDLADTVVAGVSGEPSRHGFVELAQALSAAARVVKPSGRIILLSQADPPIGPGMEMIRQADDPARLTAGLRKKAPADLVAAALWAGTVSRAPVYLLSGMAPDTAEELFVTPLDNVNQVPRLIGDTGTCVVLPDAHKTVAMPSP
jgi:nickel-dependent lactate racemase